MELEKLNPLHFELDPRYSFPVVLFKCTVLIGVLGRLQELWDTARIAPNTPTIMKIATAIDSTTSIVLSAPSRPSGRQKTAVKKKETFKAFLIVQYNIVQGHS